MPLFHEAFGDLSKNPTAIRRRIAQQPQAKKKNKNNIESWFVLCFMFIYLSFYLC